MATAPFLVDDDGEWRLDVSLGAGGRARFPLSDRAEALLVDDLGYGNRDVLPWVTTRALVLSGGVAPDDGRTDARDLSWAVTGADGGRRATDEELERVADYLRRVEIDDRSLETARELVRTTRLSAFVSTDELTGRTDRTTGLRDIARDL